MLKKAPIIILLFFASKSVFGQNFRFGILFNPAITWLQSDVNDVVPNNVRLGFDLGMSVDYFFAQNYAFATGISMFNTGGTLNYVKGIEKFRLRGENVGIAPNSDVKYKMQYIKVPVAFKFKTHLIGRMVYSANLGFDIMARASANADFRDNTGVKYEKVNANREINFLNLGWHFGGGASYSLGGDAAIFGGLAFMSTFTDLTAPEHDMITSKNIIFRIGVLF